MLELCLARLDRIPKLLVDDLEVGHLLHNDLGIASGPRAPEAGLRVLYIGEAVPGQAADVELVVQDASTAAAVAVDRARAPVAASRAGNSIVVEVQGDSLRRGARGVALKNALDDPGLGRLDLPLACHGLSV